MFISIGTDARDCSKNQKRDKEGKNERVEDCSELSHFGISYGVLQTNGEPNINCRLKVTTTQNPNNMSSMNLIYCFYSWCCHEMPYFIATTSTGTSQPNA